MSLIVVEFPVLALVELGNLMLRVTQGVLLLPENQINESKHLLYVSGRTYKT